MEAISLPLEPADVVFNTADVCKGKEPVLPVIVMIVMYDSLSDLLIHGHLSHEYSGVTVHLYLGVVNILVALDHVNAGPQGMPIHKGLFIKMEYPVF